MELSYAPSYKQMETMKWNPTRTGFCSYSFVQGKKKERKAKHQKKPPYLIAGILLPLALFCYY